MYQALDDAEYTTLRKELLSNKGGAVQREFLEAASNNSEFSALVRARVGITGDSPISVFTTRLTEGEFRDPPVDSQREIYSRVKDIQPAQACEPTLWGMVTLTQIENGIIDASYLASNGGNTGPGKARIDHVLREGTDKEVDSCVRTVIRQFSGLPEARGRRSVYVNCCFGRAWWRERLGEEVAVNTGVERKDVIDVLRRSQEFWENIVSMLVSRNSVFGDKGVRDAVVSVIASRIEMNPRDEIGSAGTLRLLCRAIGARAAWQELSVFSQEELHPIVQEEAARFSRTREEVVE